MIIALRFHENWKKQNEISITILHFVTLYLNRI